MDNVHELSHFRLTPRTQKVLESYRRGILTRRDALDDLVSLGYDHGLPALEEPWDWDQPYYELVIEEGREEMVGLWAGSLSVDELIRVAQRFGGGTESITIMAARGSDKLLTEDVRELNRNTP